MKRTAILSLALLAWTTPAAAKSVKTLDYRFGAIWSTTIRLLRVDRSYEITDKDRENGFILFVYPDEGEVKRCPASMEIVEVVDEQGFRRRRVQLGIAHQPSYVEVHLLDRLEQKLREERGEPPPPQRVKSKGKGKKDEDKDENKGKDQPGSPAPEDKPRDK